MLCSLAASILPAGCSSTLAQTGQKDLAAVLQSKASRPSRSVSALAYEHYLKARLLEQDGRLREAIYELRQALVYDHASPYLHARLGRLYAFEGLWRLVQEEAKEALTLNPDYVPALLLQARAQARVDKKNQAIKTYLRVIALDRGKIEAYAQLAELYLNQGEKQKALLLLEEMSEANPDSARGFRRLAYLYFERGDEARAEASFKRALQIDPSDTDTIATLAGLLERQGRYQEAIQSFIDALETSPGNPYYMSIMARLYLKAGDKKSATAYFDQLRANNPANARYIARVYSDLNLYQEAVRELRVVLQQHPNFHAERLLLAILHEELKQFPQAIVQLKLIPRQDRYFVNAQIHIGYSLRHLSKWEEASQVLKAALDLTNDKQDLARIHRILGEVYAGRKKYKEGMRVLNDAIRENPDLLELLEAKANLLFEAGRANAGVKLLTSALDKRRKNISLLYALGALYERMNRVDDGLNVMRQIVDIDPNNFSALNFIGYTLADQNKSLDEAERMIRRALLLDPGNGAITDSLGWVLYRQGQYQQALEHLRRADQITPGEPVIIMHVGDAYLKLGQREKAIENFRRALNSSPTPRDKKDILQRFLDLGIKP